MQLARICRSLVKTGSYRCRWSPLSRCIHDVFLTRPREVTKSQPGRHLARAKRWPLCLQSQALVHRSGTLFACNQNDVPPSVEQPSFILFQFAVDPVVGPPPPAYPQGTVLLWIRLQAVKPDRIGNRNHYGEGKIGVPSVCGWGWEITRTLKSSERHTQHRRWLQHRQQGRAS